MNTRILFSLSVAIVALAAATAQAVSIVTVPVGDAGNAADTTSYGAVAYNYNIGKYDVTNNQYCEFLNTVASASDPYGLWSAAMGADGVAGITRSGAGPYAYAVKAGQGNRPVVQATWFDAIRFANWLTAGNTESGSYAITGSGPNWTVAIPDATQRAAWAAGTAHWLLPSENEWYKAAYYKGGNTSAGYWQYATQSNTAPTWVLSTSTGPNGGANSANFWDNTYGSAVGGVPSWMYNPATDYLTDVGAYPASLSAYGTLDQCGNVSQWNEALIGSSRGVRGGNFSGSTFYESSSWRYDYMSPTSGSDMTGFRVALVGTVPEPSTMTMLFVAAATALMAGYSRRKRSAGR